MKKALLSIAVISLLSAPVFVSATVSAQQPTPAEVLDLSCWKISLPIDPSGTGKATGIDEKQIAAGYVDKENFYVNEAGDGVVFSSPVKGVLTSKNTTYTRSELHDEKGSVFLAHEPVGEDDQLYPIIGSHIPDYYNQDGEVVEPEDGIKLGEKWGYQIKAVGHELTVTIRREGKEDAVQVVDMSKSKYDAGGQYMFFKAGVYNQNKTATKTKPVNQKNVRPRPSTN